MKYLEKGRDSAGEFCQDLGHFCSKPIIHRWVRKSAFSSEVYVLIAKPKSRTDAFADKHDVVRDLRNQKSQFKVATN